MVSGPGSGSLTWAKVSRVMYRRQTAHSSDCSARMAPTEACDGGIVGEDADDVGPALDLLVDALQEVGGVDFGAVVPGEGHEGEHVGLGLVHEPGEGLEAGRRVSATWRHWAEAAAWSS